MANRPFSVSVTLVFVLLNGLVWLAFGAFIASNLHPALSVPAWVRWTMAVLSLVVSGALLALFIFLRKRTRLAYYLSLACFFVAALLTLFDQFGLADLVVVAINLVPFVLLIKDRAWYLR
jgi:hypothetical protein